MCIRDSLWRLCEIDYPDLLAGLRRVQMVWAVKEEGPVLHMKDLGPSSAFLAMPIEITSGIERPSGSWGVLTVGQGLRQAELARHEGETEAGLEFVSSLVDFEEDFRQALENTRRWNAHKSVFGPMHTKVRG